MPNRIRGGTARSCAPITSNASLHQRATHDSPRSAVQLHGCTTWRTPSSMLVRMALVALVTLAGCAPPRRPSFLTRVLEDCAAGDQWACNFLDATQHPRQ